MIFNIMFLKLLLNDFDMIMIFIMMIISDVLFFEYWNCIFSFLVGFKGIVD